jgi:hypothetical protein
VFIHCQVSESRGLSTKCGWSTIIHNLSLIDAYQLSRLLAPISRLFMNTDHERPNIPFVFESPRSPPNEYSVPFRASQIMISSMNPCTYQDCVIKYMDRKALANKEQEFLRPTVFIITVHVKESPEFQFENSIHTPIFLGLFTYPTR